MKLRNKLVAVLAASMVVTSVPVVTMADTTNYMSTSRYAQKGTTFGYLTGSYGGYDTVYGQATGGIGGSDIKKGYDYNFSNGFEFVPVNTYSQTDTTYMSLTADSEFNTKAMVAYVDAFNSASGTTNLQFDADGKVVNANNPAYNGQTADELLKSGITMYYSGTFNNRVAVSEASRASVVTAASSVSAADIETKAKAVFDARIKAMGSDLYTAMSNADMLTSVRNTFANSLGTALSTGTITVAPSLKVLADTTQNPLVKTAVDAVAVNNAEISTTYAQLYKANNGVSVIDTAKLAEVLAATQAEVNSWVLGESLEAVGKTYEEEVDSATKLTIQKVDLINFKDANDREYKSHLRITSTGTFIKDMTYKIPVLAKLGGDKTVILDVNGKDSNITSGKYNLTQDALTDKRLTVTADSKKIRTNYTDEIGEIRLTESTIGALTSKDNRRIKIELPASSDLEFNLSKTTANAKVTGKRGFFAVNVDGDAELEGATDAVSSDTTVLTAKGNSKNSLRVAYGVESRRNQYSDSDKQTLIIELPAWADATSVGELVISGLYVQPVDDTAATGDVNATVSEYLANGETSTNLLASTTVKVAEVKDYDISLTCEKPVDIKAGRSGIVNENKTTFVLEEAVKDSLVDGRKIKFVVENGYIFGPADVDYTDIAANANGYYSTGLYGSVEYKARAEKKFLELIDNEKIKFEEKAGKDGSLEGFVKSSLALEIDAEGRVIGFSGEYDRLKDSEADKIKVTMPIATDVMSKGEVKIVAENLYTRSFQDKEEDPSCVIANVIEPIEVAFDGAKLKVGLQAQEAGSITITETDKGMIENGWLFLAAQDQEGITFDNVPTVTVEGADGKTLTVKNVALSKDKTMLGLEITKESLEASTIKITNINLTADRTVPEANYDLAIWGTALTDENELGITNFTQNALYSHTYFNQTSDLYVVADFVQMTTVNTEDLSSAAKAVTTSFVIGQSKFTVNGEEKTMDAAAYAKDGYTFVPVRYLAQAFGIQGNAVQYDKSTSTATIVSGDKVVNITNGKSYIVVNGTNMPMATKAEVKDGRMCVPMAYIAAALGVEKSWDATTKTATFTNQSK